MKTATRLTKFPARGRLLFAYALTLLLATPAWA
jgi:hypothetical protein